MKLKYHSVVQKQGCRTLRKDERVIAKEVREASEMSHQNIRNGPLPGGELQVREETHQYRTMGKGNIRKWVREASEMSHQNIRNGPWSGRELQVREETHQYRNLGKESIRKWVLEAAVLANNCWDPQQFMYIYIYICRV